MPVQSLQEAKSLTLIYLEDTYKQGQGGWGLLKPKEVSITNTAEALLTFKQWDALNQSFIEDRKSEIANFLEASLRTCIEDKKPRRTRDVANALLGLHLLGRRDLETEAVEALLRMANERGGWPSVEGDEKGLLVPTYQVISVLQRLQRPVSDSHYDWLLNLQKTDNLCAFSPGDNDTAFGASSLVLYLLARSAYRDKVKVKSLAERLCQELPIFFSSMQGKDESWVSIDRNTAFRIYGYGHALSALSRLGFDLAACDMGGFLKQCNRCGGRNVKADEPCICSFDPTVTWIPAILEFSMALRAIRLDFDPLRFLKTSEQKTMSAVSEELKQEKAILEVEREKLHFRQIVIDELEKNVIRQRVQAQQVLTEVTRAAKEAVTQDIQISMKEIKVEIRNVALFWLAIASLFALGAIPTVVKIAQKTFSFGDFESTSGLTVAIVAVVIPLIEWRSKVFAKAKRRLNQRSIKP